MSRPMDQWTYQVEPFDSGRTCKVTCLNGGQPIAYAAALELWQQDAGFRSAFTALLAEAPFDAYFWETPPVTAETLSQTFEFVLVDSPALARPAADPADFHAHFRSAAATAKVVTFANLGGDAVLVAPCPGDPPAAYAHLAAFSRQAGADQQHAFWRAVGTAMTARVGTRPVWLSTSGLGVAWLHVRLDTRPKYYTHRPYRTQS